MKSKNEDKIRRPIIYITTPNTITGKEKINSQAEENESVDLSLISCDRSQISNTNTLKNDIINPSARTTVNVYKISSSNAESKFKEYIEKEKYDLLKYKHDKLKEKYHNIRRQEKNWRTSYFEILKESIEYDETLKNLIEENRIHQEYIISLENKINRLLKSCNRISENFHNNLIQIKNIEIINPINNISNTILKNYNDIVNDYKQQIDILAEEKENLSTNLSISRHQQLQFTLKLEQIQNRILFLEQARMEDIKILQNLKNLTP